MTRKKTKSMEKVMGQKKVTHEKEKNIQQNVINKASKKRD